MVFVTVASPAYALALIPVAVQTLQDHDINGMLTRLDSTKKQTPSLEVSNSNSLDNIFLSQSINSLDKSSITTTDYSSDSALEYYLVGDYAYSTENAVGGIAALMWAQNSYETIWSDVKAYADSLLQSARSDEMQNALDSVIGGSHYQDEITITKDSLVLAGNNNDTINASIGNNIIDGGDLSDTISYSSSAKGVDVDLGVGNTYYVDEFTGSPKDTLGNIENVMGTLQI